MSIAETILNQLGNQKFIAMVRPKALLDTGKGLGVQIKGNKTFTVELNENDTYKIQLTKFNTRKVEITTLKELDGVYAENLREIFEDFTGLLTSL